MPVTADGYTVRSESEIRQEIDEDQRANIDPVLDTSDETELGKLNAIFSRKLAELETTAELCYDAFDPDRADHDRLTNVAKITGTARRGASHTLVSCIVVAAQGTVLKSGEAFAQVTDEPATRFTPTEDFVSPSTGAHAVMFRAEKTGEIEVPLGLAAIATPVIGWTSVEVMVAHVGRVADSDETLQERRAEQLERAGSSTVNALESDILAIDDVENVTVFENTTNMTDANGLPAHSFEVLVFDGDPPAADDDEIAQTIWDTRPAGIRAYGSESGTATDKDGNERSVAFSRVTTRPVYIAVTLTIDSALYPVDGDELVKAALVAAARETNSKPPGSGFRRRAGEEVVYTRLLGVPYEVAGVKRVVALTLGFAASPTGTDDLAIGPRELAAFDESRVTVTT